MAAAVGGSDVAREIVPAQSDGSLDALLVLRVCKVRKLLAFVSFCEQRKVPVPNLVLPEPKTEKEAARLVEVSPIYLFVMISRNKSGYWRCEFGVENVSGFAFGSFGCSLFRECFSERFGLKISRVVCFFFLKKGIHFKDSMLRNE